MNQREKLADYAHEAWSGWMEYLFSKCGIDHNYGTFMPQGIVERWRRQISTPYAELSESEKESDRAEADKMLAIVQPRITALRDALVGIEHQYQAWATVTQNEETTIINCVNIARQALLAYLEGEQ